MKFWITIFVVAALVANFWSQGIAVGFLVAALVYRFVISPKLVAASPPSSRPREPDEEMTYDDVLRTPDTVVRPQKPLVPPADRTGTAAAATPVVAATSVPATKAQAKKKDDSTSSGGDDGFHVVNSSRMSDSPTKTTSGGTKSANDDANNDSGGSDSCSSCGD